MTQRETSSNLDIGVYVLGLEVFFFFLHRITIYVSLGTHKGALSVGDIKIVTQKQLFFRHFGVHWRSNHIGTMEISILREIFSILVHPIRRTLHYFSYTFEDK